MEPKTKVFLLRNPENPLERRFIHGVVLRRELQSVTVRFADQDLPAGGIVTMFYRENDRFLQREFLLSQVSEDAEGKVFTLLTLSESEYADSRSSKRVSTEKESLLADFGGETECVVLDISEDGIALVAAKSHAVGLTQELEVTWPHSRYTGNVTICSITPVSDDAYRYGVRCREDHEGQTLSKALRQMWLDLNLGLQPR